MSSLKKRATWGMIISMVCLVVGIVCLYHGHDALDHALKKGFTEIDKVSDDDLVRTLFFGMLPGAVGISLAVLGFVLFPLSLAAWIRNPPPGSKLGFRGWKTPAQMTESDIAQEKAWKAIFWGQLASQTWILEFVLGGFRAFRSLHSSPPFLLKLQFLLIVMCVAFYAMGIRLCRRRDPASVAAAPGTWKAALALNYGGLLVFLGLVGTFFFMRFRA